MIIFMLFIIPAISTSAVADSEAKLDVQIYGGLPLPFLIRNAGGVITNIGDTTAYDISYILTIIGGISNNINVTIEDYYDYLEPLGSSDNALGVFTVAAYGFGIVTITFTASASNAESVTVKAKGFQIGDITWVPLSWIAPPFLKDIIPWLDF